MSQIHYTIANSVSCFGIGLHSGQKTQLILRPAPPGTGIIFVRSDVSKVDNKIAADYLAVSDTVLSTTIANDAGITVSTIEHLMAAIWGYGIDNLIIELDGPEVPIMDGSSQPFMFMLECSAKKPQHYKKPKLQLTKEISIEDNGCYLVAKPAKQQTIELKIDFPDPAIGVQKINFTASNNFSQEIANSRTFGFMKDIKYLQNQGLAKGASLDNAIGIEAGKVLNPSGLRHPDEFVRHKLLDLFGDFALANCAIIADINGFKTSHKLNNLFLRKLFSTPGSYKLV